MEPKPIMEILLPANKVPDLVDPSYLISPEEEEFILTEEEEQAAIDHEIDRVKKFYVWHMADQGQTEGQILQKLSEIDFSKDPNIDRKKILARANAAKHNAMWHEKQRRKDAERDRLQLEELKKQWNATQIFRLMQWTSENQFGKQLIRNENNFPLMKALCFFLSEDPRFETELGFSLRKGIIIRGVSGLGKSYLVNCVAKNGLNPITALSMIEIAESVKRSGEYQIPPGKVFYLDDVGTESTPIVHYGTRINWFKDFLEIYYDTKKPYNRLMISTNISFSEIEEKYTHRVRSRMKEMFNVIDVVGEDLRG